MTIEDDLIEIVRYFGAFERESVCCGDVTVAQCLALQALLPGERDVSGLAEYAGGSPSAMTRLLGTLESKGWIGRRRDAEDRRRVWIALTGDGRLQAESLRRRSAEAVAEVLERIPEAQRGMVVEAIGLLREAMAAVRRPGVVCCP